MPKPSETIEGEVIAQPLVPANLPEMRSVFAVLDPDMFLHRMKQGAATLVNVVRSKNLIVKGLNSRVPDEEYMEFEGWQMLGAMFQTYPFTEWTRELRDGKGEIFGYETRVIVKHKDGTVLGSAEGMCAKDESTWKNRPLYAIRSMAQTRTAAKALRSVFGFVLVLEGVRATPADEMKGIDAPPEANVNKVAPKLGTTRVDPRTKSKADSKRNEMVGRINRMIENLSFDADTIQIVIAPATQMKKTSH